MAVHISYRSIPELSALPLSERRAIWVSAYRQGWRKSARNWIAALFGLLVLPGAWVFASAYFGLPFWPSQLVTLLLITMGGGFMGHVATRSAIPYIRNHVSHRRSNVGA